MGSPKRMTRRQLNAWIAARRAEGYWCTPCPGPCGFWFAQKRSVRGRRAIICGLQLCQLWQRFRRNTGHAPCPQTIAVWRTRFGDAPRPDGPKRHEEERVCATLEVVPHRSAA